MLKESGHNTVAMVSLELATIQFQSHSAPHQGKDANHYNFCGIILIFKSDSHYRFQVVKIWANNDFKTVPDKTRMRSWWGPIANPLAKVFDPKAPSSPIPGAWPREQNENCVQYVFYLYFENTWPFKTPGAQGEGKTKLCCCTPHSCE